MLNYILKPIRHPSFYKKYAGKRYLKVGLYMSAPVELTHILLIGKLIHETVGARSLAREYTSITGCRVACTEGRNSDGGTVGRGAPRSMFIRNGEEFAIMLWLSIKLFVFFILVCYVHRSHSILTHQPHAESVSSTHPHFTNPAFHNNRLLSSIHFVRVRTPEFKFSIVLVLGPLSVVSIPITVLSVHTFWLLFFCSRCAIVAIAVGELILLVDVCRFSNKCNISYLCIRLHCDI